MSRRPSLTLASLRALANEVFGSGATVLRPNPYALVLKERDGDRCDVLFQGHTFADVKHRLLKYLKALQK